VHTLDVTLGWRRSQLAAVLWTRPGAPPGAAVVVPLLHEGVPTVALPYALAQLAAELGAAHDVVLATGGCAGVPSEVPVAAHVRVTVTADPEGDVFAESGLLNQELAKHPPSRRRIESILLRREHWWYVPRLLVHLHDPRDARPLTPADAVLAVGDERLTVATCHLDDRAPLRLSPADGDALPSGRATVLEHGADLPDIEAPWERRWEGRVTDGRFETDRVDADDGPRDGPLTLRERMRLERRLERACRAGLRAAGIG
jgi:hypothetical protein